MYSRTILENLRYFSSLDTIKIYGRQDVPIPPSPPSITVKPFGTATDAELAEIINGYYDGDISLEEIQDVWSVGDTRDINLSAISATVSDQSVGESHPSQTVTLQILDFEHDILASDNTKKALITVDLKNCLCPSLTIYGNENPENGYMNDIASNAGGWFSSKRREWCNNGFYNALPTYIKDLIKPVTKYAGTGGNGSGGAVLLNGTDKVFLLSEVEISGDTDFSLLGEGTQYSQYITPTNRYKLPQYSQYSAQSNIWWTRTADKTFSSYFCDTNSWGYIEREVASNASGIAPAFCM